MCPLRVSPEMRVTVNAALASLAWQRRDISPILARKEGSETMHKAAAAREKRKREREREKREGKECIQSKIMTTTRR